LARGKNDPKMSKARCFEQPMEHKQATWVLFAVQIEDKVAMW